MGQRREPEDQVLRRLDFERRHPEWCIDYLRDKRIWRAIREGVTGYGDVVTEDELRALLDRLEARSG